MPLPGHAKIVLAAFAGQGTSRATLALAADQAIRDVADSPTSALLLASCLDAFFAELAALSPEELDQSGICPSDFDDPRRLLTPDPKYAQNHVIAAIFLFLVQVIRYQSYAQATSRSLLDPLRANADHAVGIIGLSSGIFPACVVAASPNPLSYITHAVQVCRLVFWIALRVVQFTRKLLRERPVDPTLPWSIACLGLTKTDVEQHIARFEHKHCHVPSLRVTAVVDEHHMTVSGRPDLLVRFSTFVSRHCTVLPTTVDALYHSDLHLPHTRDQILADVRRRHVRFPDYHHLLCPLRSTVSGDIVGPCPEYPSLLDLVIDMVLVRPVDWHLVAKKVASAVPADAQLCAVNIGPGSGTLRALERVVPECVLHCTDASSSARADAPPAAPKQAPIAIVGMAVHAPGAANAAQLWELLEKGINTVSKIPDDRFPHAALDGGSSSPTEITGNFIHDVAHFDHKFFKISPREARSMDPQQRVLLHTAYEALESAGYVPDATPCFRRATFGCYIGAATQDYADNLADTIDVFYSTGTLKAFLSGRISYAMQFGGPSVVVDTACSSSIVAIHQACRALMVKDCDAALAGGVNVMTSPNMFAGLARGHFLTPSGQCKSFDAAADGYSRGEGCCLFVLKRLSDAVAEKDAIMGVIRGVEVNQSGLAPSITHPHGPTQADLLKRLLAHSGVCPTRVSVVEAHGTGTEVGDACELASVRAVLSPGRTRDAPLHVTSIKANIGHLEAASGAVGLCKLLLMLRHDLVPAQISLRTLHPLIAPLDTDHTVIDARATPWVAGSTPRVSVLNNFGAAGSNGALVLEEYIKPRRLAGAPSGVVFGMSAKSAEALEVLRARYMQWLGDARHDDVRLDDVAYTVTARRQLYPFRLAVAAGDKAQLVRALGAAPVAHVERGGRQVVFVFSGQGSQYVGMGASLYAASPTFRSCIDRCQRCLASLGYPGILHVIAPGTCDRALAPGDAFEAHQCAVLAVEFALATLWKQWGIVPAGVIGQSLGEYAAMVVAEVLSIETALSIVAKRARLMSRACAIGKTGMTSVALASGEVQEMLATHASFSSIAVACVNTDASCVVSGPVRDLRAFAAHLERAVGVRKTVALGVQLGFHSSAMDPILDDLGDHVATLAIRPPTIPIASNVLGSVVPAGDGSTFRADYFVKHCRQPVLFAQGLRALERYLDPSDIAAWIDVGPHTVCLPMVETTLSPSPETLCLASMVKDVPAWDTLTRSLARLYKTAVPVDWRRVFDERVGACACVVDLPSYPFDSHPFYAPFIGHAVHAASEPTIPRHALDHPMLASWSQYPSRQNGNAAVFETPIARLARYVQGHKVGGYALCPASVYLEQALAGAVVVRRHMELDFGPSMPVLRAVAFSRPLVLGQGLIVRTHVTVHEDGVGAFQITSRRASSREERVHVHGELRFSSVRETASGLALALPGQARRAAALTACEEGGSPEVFSTHAAYEVVFPRVVEYAKEYHTMRSLTVSDDGRFGTARVALAVSSSALQDGAQPVFLDTLLHVAGFMVNMRGDVSDAYICSGIGTLKVLRDLVDEKEAYVVYCTLERRCVRDFVTADVLAVRTCDARVAVAQLQGAQFRRVRLASLHRGLAIAADPGGGGEGTGRTRTDSNAIVTPMSPRSVIFSRSRSSTRSTAFYGVGVDDADEVHTSGSCSGPTSPETLVSESGGMHMFEGHAGVDEEHVRGIMADVLGIMDSGEIKSDVDLGSLGLDSLGVIEALQALRVALGRPVPHNVFVKCSTLGALCDFLAVEDGDGLDLKGHDDGGACYHRPSSEVALVALQQQCAESPRNIPLYLVHDGSGLVTHYERLLPLHRDVWGLGNPRFFSDDREQLSWETLDAMAEAYACAVERHADGGALILGGWSFGGVVAFEMARMLVTRGVGVKGVVLIDVPPPSGAAAPLLSNAMIDHVLRLRDRDHECTTGASSVGRQFRQNTALLERYVPVRPPAVSFPLAFLRCTVGFRPSGDVDVPVWFRDREREQAGAVVGPWEDMVRGHVPVWDVPGHHFEPFSGAHVEETSAQLDRACRYLETGLHDRL